MSNTVAAEDLRSHLARFGLTTFRPGQEEVIQAVLAGQDCLCIMPTGGGKSLCYQLPAVARTGVTLVVSPLIALMKDQVDQLSAIGISATYVNSTLSGSEQRERLLGMSAGRYDLVYIAPERIRNPLFVEAVRETQVQLLAVDEAHCISEWGHDFRPDYARLGQLREKLGTPQTIALTATATPGVRTDVVRLLKLADPRVFISGFARPNLRFRVLNASGGREKVERLLTVIRAAGGPGIVYSSTRKGCEDVAEELARELRISVGLYHAGLMPDERREVQERFMRGELPVIVATNAFGMGINKTDLRFVVHYNMPGTLEAYYQEAGRAGRDGMPAECLLLFSYQDRYIQDYFIENNYPSRETVARVWDFLRSQREDPIEITLLELKERLDLGVGTEGISASEQILEKAGALKRLDAQQNRASVWLESDLPTLSDLLPRDAKSQRSVLQAIERLVGDRRFERVTFPLDRLAAMTSLDRTAVNRALRELMKLDAFDYVPPFRGRAIHVLKADVPFSQLGIDFAELEKRKAAEYEKLERMVAYAQSRRCRQREILDYFGESHGSDCKSCDNCGGPALSVATSEHQDNEDLIRVVRIALSGVARASGRFGNQVVAQMLAGSQSSKIRKNQLDQLSTFGLLAQFTQQDVQSLLDELQRCGLVQQSEVDRFRPILQLTGLGSEIMRDGGPLPGTLRVPEAIAARLGVTARGSAPAEDAAASAASAAEEQDEGDALPSPARQSVLFEKLRRWRAEKASQQGVPHYRIVPTSVLEQLVTSCPTTCEQLLEIRGVGPSTVERFGEELLLLIQTHRAGPVSPLDALAEARAEPADQQDAASADQAAGHAVAVEPIVHMAPDPVPKSAAGPARPGDTIVAHGSQPECYWTWRLLSAGFRPRECAAIRRMGFDDVFRHALEASERGWDVDVAWLFSAEQLEALRQAAGEPAAQVSGGPALSGLPAEARRAFVELSALSGRGPG